MTSRQFLVLSRESTFPPVSPLTFTHIFEGMGGADGWTGYERRFVDRTDQAMRAGRLGGPSPDRLPEASGSHLRILPSPYPLSESVSSVRSVDLGNGKVPPGGRGDLPRTHDLRLRTSQDDGSYERISRGFREYTGEDKAPAFLILAALAVVLVGVVLYGLLRRDRGGDRQLFRRLADANGLTGPERRLLQAVARRAGEDHLPALFFRRALFDEATAEMAADRDLLESVRRKVYDP